MYTFGHFMKFLYILYICKWPSLNTVYYFVTNILYKEPANTCYTDDRKGQVLLMWVLFFQLSGNIDFL